MEQNKLAAEENMETGAGNENTGSADVTMKESGNKSGLRNKRKQRNGDGTPKKKRKSVPFYQKNALMQLNELKPGLTYDIESQRGPPHNPEFEVSVTVDGQKYIGRGNSKQMAKHAAAQAALSSFVQFQNTPEAMNIINQPTGVSYTGMVDFTKDNVENEGCNFNKFEVRKNGTEEEVLISTGLPAKKAHPLKVLTEADKKNPVMLLNEVYPGIEYDIIEENSSVASQRFRAILSLNDQRFEGTGQNKKMAKAAAARAALSGLYNVSSNVFRGQHSADIASLPQGIADKVAKQLMSTFKDVMLGNPEHAKWKIIAGIGMTKDELMEDVQIIGFGTGTKCIVGENISMIGASINDCHAEIISRRCLKDFFYTNLELLLEGEAEESIFMKRNEGGYCLKPNVKFHLYISTAPCGDARIFSPHEESIALDPVDRHPNRQSRGVLRTKIESGEGTIPIKDGQCIQTWDSILPGQQRLLTMSCSDKIASWNVLGLQGALLSYFIEPIYLESVILGGLFHPNHLRRALFGRIDSHLKDLPALYKLNKPKLCATTSPETRNLAKSPNFSVNWSLGLGRAEVINSLTGKTESGLVSRLSKKGFFQRFMNIYDRLAHINTYTAPKDALYGAYKDAAVNYREAQKALTAAFLAAGLGQWMKKPIEQHEFTV